MSIIPRAHAQGQPLRAPNSIPIIVNHLGRTVIIGKRQEQAAAGKASKLAVYR